MILNISPFSTNSVGKFVRYAVLLCGCAAIVAPGQAAADPAAPVTDLVRRFAEAQVAMDVPTLTALTEESYIEVSPVGEVDPREKMLTFYRKDEKRTLPTMQIEDSAARIFGDTAVVIAKISYATVVEGQSRSFSLRSSFVAQKGSAGWKLVSAHHTAIRPKAPGR